jgi:hypothetical protein
MLTATFRRSVTESETPFSHARRRVNQSVAGKRAGVIVGGGSIRANDEPVKIRDRVFSLK